jgi:putative flippase GtrA
MNDSVPARSGRGAWLQLLRYGVVGLATNAAGYSLYLLATWLGVPPKLAITFLYPAGVALSFASQRRFTFDDQGGLRSSGFRFVLAHCASYLINLGLQVVLVDHLGFDHRWVQGISVFVMAAFLFVALRYFVFTTPSAARP